MSTTRLTFANNCPAKMLVSVGGRRAAQSDSKQSLFGSRGLFPQSPAKLMTTPGALLACAIVEEGTTKRRSRSKFHRRRRKRRKIERRRARWGRRMKQGKKDTLCSLMTPGIRLVSDIEKITCSMKGRRRLSDAVEHENDTR